MTAKNKTDTYEVFAGDFKTEDEFEEEVEEEGLNPEEVKKKHFEEDTEPFEEEEEEEGKK